MALALLTDQLEQWHDYLATKGLKPGRPFAARPGSAHDGFVIKDPEGYLLEFERFNQHPENERFVPLLKANRTVRAPKSPLPEGLGFKATITWLYYKAATGRLSGTTPRVTTWSSTCSAPTRRTPRSCPISGPPPRSRRAR